jgi:hypothetical protein
MAFDPLDPKNTVRPRTAWGHGARGTQGTDPRGAAVGTNIGSHEVIPGSARKQADLDAGMRGERARGGPKGGNAPPASKKPSR